LSLGPVASLASDAGDHIKTVDGSFEEVFQNMQDAVINTGLVIDYVGHVNKMLERTSGVAGEGKSPYLSARYFQFCSSTLTHDAVSADVKNLAMCPYVIFAYETQARPGKISVGYREPVLTSSVKSKTIAAKVRTLLQKIIDAAGPSD